MSVKILRSAEDLASYDRWVKTHPQGNLWQSLEWKKYQEALGRETRVYSLENASHESRETALVIIDRTSFGLSTWDCPRGPLSGSQDLIKKIIEDAKHDRCLSLYFSPSLSLETHDSRLSTSSRHEQPDATRILDLTLSDEQLLAQMHQKGRYNINVARKNGILIERSDDIDAYYELAQKTGKRDQFGIPRKQQLAAFLEKLDGSFLLLAYASHENASYELREREHFQDSKLVTRNSKPIAGLIGVTWGSTGYYYYGASDYEHRSLMAPYLLQWEAMQLCRKMGCVRYDLLGIAPPIIRHENASHESRVTNSTHPWAGISDFKAKFGGSVIIYPPEQEIVLKPITKQLLTLKRKMIG